MQQVFSALERLSAQKTMADGEAVLFEETRRMGMSHAAYVTLNLPNATQNQRIMAVSYPDEWQRHYQARNYVTIDPVVTACLSGVIPVDWADFSREPLSSKQLFDDAHARGVGPHGLSVPIRGPHGELAVFSVTSDRSAGEWRTMKAQHLSHVMLLSCYFHEWAMRMHAPQTREAHVALSPRELECLQWSAAGKSLWDISTILNLSERTVRFHLDNVRTKLNAVTTVQAAVKASHLGLITPS